MWNRGRLRDVLTLPAATPDQSQCEHGCLFSSDAVCRRQKCVWDLTSTLLTLSLNQNEKWKQHIAAKCGLCTKLVWQCRV